MREGGTRQLIIPPDLGYGDQEQPGIPANSTLWFEIEVMEVLP
jgi:FKBP-type peptidyl-prolyl cis-trans isomerase